MNTFSPSNTSAFDHILMLMDASPNFIIITDGHHASAANKTLLDFFDFPTIEAFSKRHQCICTLFEPYAKNALLPQMGDRTWIEEVLASPDAHLAYIKHRDTLYAFKVHAGEIYIDHKRMYSVIFNDVTELEMQKERYAQAIEGAQIGLWDWNLENNTIHFEPRWKEMLGYRDDELLNSFETWQERVHPEDLPSALQAIQDNIEGRTPFYDCTHRLRHKDGHWVWIEDKGKTFFNQDGKAIRMVGVHNDISLLKESEIKIQLHALRSEALMKLPKLNETLDEVSFLQSGLEEIETLTHSPISFVHFINDNEQSIELVTWSKNTLSHYCHALYNTHYPVNDAGIWADALRERRVIVVNDYASHTQKQGLPHGHASLSRFISLPIIEENKVVMLCGIGNKPSIYTDEDIQTLQLFCNEIWRLVQHKRNLAKLKHTQELLIAQSRNAAMGEMVSMIAHQWRQPISVIGMCANNMLLDMELETMNAQEFQKQLRDILFQTEHLSATIDDFRNFFRPDKNKESVRVQSILEDALKLMQKSFDNNLIYVSCSFKSETALMLYSRELMQVFLNIFKNAKEAFDNRYLAECFIHVNLYETKESVIASICDNAGGIQESVIEKIFEPYFSTKNEKNGTGLGLYMSKIIVEKHLLGELRAYNSAEGACFEVILPKAD